MFFIMISYTFGQRCADRKFIFLFLELITRKIFIKSSTLYFSDYVMILFVSFLAKQKTFSYSFGFSSGQLILILGLYFSLFRYFSSFMRLLIFDDDRRDRSAEVLRLKIIWQIQAGVWQKILWIMKITGRYQLK